MKLNEVKKEISTLASDIKSLLKKSGYDADYELFVDDDKLTADQYYQLVQLRKIFSKLDAIKETADYMNRPIKAEGTLHQNADGKFAIDNKVFSCGSEIEFMVYDDDIERNTFVCSRIEYKSDCGYYIYNYPDVLLEGLRVRIR